MKFHVWPDDTFCTDEHLAEYLSFMSDDYLTAVIPECCIGDGPTYEQALAWVQYEQALRRMLHDEVEKVKSGLRLSIEPSTMHPLHDFFGMLAAMVMIAAVAATGIVAVLSVWGLLK